MNTQIKLIASLVMSLLIFGTASAEAPQSDIQTTFLNVCRNSSLIRGGHKPDIFVNDVVVGEIANGSKIKLAINVGDKYSIKTQASPLMFRFKDESLYQGKVVNNEEVYLIVKGELASAGAIASQLLGGAIAESIRQNNDETPSGDWSIKLLTKPEFEIQCIDVN